jgi:hypothetical protein
MSAAQKLSEAEAEDFHRDIDRVLKNMTMGLSLKHGANPTEVSLTGVETLVGYMATISPEGIADYLAALAWVMRTKAHGTDSTAAMHEYRRTIWRIRAEVELLSGATEGSA